MNHQKTTKDATQSPAAWFCVLETARIGGDAVLAARARRELLRLGVSVRFRRRTAKKAAGGEVARRE